MGEKYEDGSEDLSCEIDINNYELSEENKIIIDNMVRFLNNTLDNIGVINELSDDEIRNKIIQDDVLNIIDTLILNDIKVGNTLYEYIFRDDTERYKDDNITLTLLNSLVQTIGKNYTVIDLRKLEGKND